MRLIRQIKLYLKKGSVKNVYEVDLCEAGDGEFVVNFRYGKRGETLREGTKTVFPVDELEAARIFDQLVAAKIERGYSATSEDDQPLSDTVFHDAVSVSETVQVAAPRLDSDPRAVRVLSYLQQAARGEKQPGGDWSLSRILWRAGEMELSAAAPLLVKIAANGEAMHDAALAWALGRCGDVSCYGAVHDLYATTQHAPAKRMALAAMLRWANRDRCTALDTGATAIPEPPCRGCRRFDRKGSARR